MLKTTKKCTLCAIEKSTTEFPKNKQRKDGYTNWCKDCESNRKSKYYKTRTGLLCRIYSHQRHNSIRRGHAKPTYSIVELQEWCKSNPLFEKLFLAWEYSGYLKGNSPSVDRIKDELPYSLNNIQLMTWGENNSKAYEDRKTHVSTKQSRKIIKYHQDGYALSEYHSTRSAKRKTGIDAGNIIKCCKGKLKTAGGFIWKYKE